MTILISLAFLAILASLATALFFMIRGGKSDDAANEDPSTPTAGTAPTEPARKPTSGMARALAFRVGISVIMFICVLISWKMGWIQPTGLPVGK